MTSYAAHFGCQARPREKGRRGLSVIELLVVISIFGVLLALIIPAIVQGRAVSRRTQCKSNLRQLGVAIANFQTAHRHFPPWAGTGNLSFHVLLLPHLDQQPLYERFVFSGPGDLSDRNQSIAVEVGRIALPLHRCPSDPAGGKPDLSGALATNYAGNFGSGALDRGFDGMFGFEQPGLPGPPFPGKLRPQDVEDGLSSTALLSEILVGDGTWGKRRTPWKTPQSFGNGQLEQFAEHCRSLPGTKPPNDGDPWARGRPWTVAFGPNSLFYNHVLPPNSKSCQDGNGVPRGIYSAGSLHQGGVNVLFADGRVEFIAEGVDLQVWRDYGSRR